MILSNGGYSYFSHAKQPHSVQDVARWASDILAIRAIQFDAIVATGVSGLTIAPVIAYRLGVPFVAVRKDDDRSTHSSNLVEGVLPERYIIVDDLIETGGTVEYIKERMCQHSAACGFDAEATKCVAYLLYQEYELITL